MELNKIYNEDCLEGMKRIPDKSIDMILCDLPYGTTKCKWDIVIPFDKLWEQYERVIKSNGAIVLTATQPFASNLLLSNQKMYRHSWYWNKESGGNPLVAKYRPMSTIEEILVFSKKRVNYYPLMQIAKKENQRPRNKMQKRKSDFIGGLKEFKSSRRHDERRRYPKNLLTYNGRSGEMNATKRVHPTQKPVALFEYLIKTYSNEGETILDNCMGSGTTAIACLNTNRQFIGFELDKEYYDIAVQRVADHHK